MRTFAATLPVPADFGTVIIGLPEGTDLDVDLRLEAVMEGVLVSGTVSGLAVGECARCLDEVRLPVEVPVAELFVYPERAEAAIEEGDEAEDLRVLEDDLIDLEPVLRDEVVPALPFTPLCRPDCPGLCSECGARFADDPDHRHESFDPRWGPLQALTETLDEKRES